MVRMFCHYFFMEPAMLLHRVICLSRYRLLVLPTIAAVLVCGNQYAFPQAIDTPLRSVGEPNTSEWSRLSQLEKMEQVLSEDRLKNRHPYSSLKIFIGDSSELDRMTTERSPKDSIENTGFRNYILFRDGTVFIESDHFELKRVSPESVVKDIELEGGRKNHCVVKLWAVDPKVDFSSVTKAVLSLKGVEKKFRRFEIKASLAKSSKSSKNHSSRMIVEKDGRYYLLKELQDTNEQAERE